MSQHLEVIVILNVTALDESHAPINNSKFCMERSKDGPVEIDDLEIDIGDLTRRGQLYFSADVLFFADTQSVIPCLMIH